MFTQLSLLPTIKLLSSVGWTGGWLSSDYKANLSLSDLATADCCCTSLSFATKKSELSSEKIFEDAKDSDEKSIKTTTVKTLDIKYLHYG